MCLDDHSCVFFEDGAELWPMCADSVAAAERAEFKWLVISERRAVGGYSLDTATLPAGSISTASAFGMSETPFSINRVIGKIRERCEAAVAEGFAGLLLLIDMSWLLRTPSGIAQHGEFEAALQELVLGTLPLRAVCLYHLTMFPEWMVLDAMRTHPKVRTRDGEFENPHFLMPRTFLSGNAAEKLGAWLGSLRPFSLAANSRSQPIRPKASRTVAASASNASPRLAVINNTNAAQAEPDGLGHRWKIRCFGNLRIYRQDSTLVQWNVANGATTKTKTLFAYLLHCGVKGASADEIADLLWPQADSLSKSMNRLYHTIHCLRMALSPDLKCSRTSPYIIGHEHHYRLSLPEGTWVDVPTFEQFCRRAEKLLKADQLEEALACYVSAERLYTGSLLSDIPVEYAENIDRDWCWSRRYWLEEIHVKMLTQMSCVYRRLENLERATVYAERALKLEPCFEPAHQELMHIFHQSGRRDAIERQYRLCMGALKRHEDRAPSANTRVLFQRLVS
jgi:two-component SAPR family response regulator